MMGAHLDPCFVPGVSVVKVFLYPLCYK